MKCLVYLIHCLRLCGKDAFRYIMNETLKQCIYFSDQIVLSWLYFVISHKRQSVECYVAIPNQQGADWQLEISFSTISITHDSSKCTWSLLCARWWRPKTSTDIRSSTWCLHAHILNWLARKKVVWCKQCSDLGQILWLTIIKICFEVSATSCFFPIMLIKTWQLAWNSVHERNHNLSN